MDIEALLGMVIQTLNMCSMTLILKQVHWLTTKYFEYCKIKGIQFMCY